MMAPAPSPISVYNTIAELDEHHRVFLVQHIYSKRIYVRKDLSVYSLPVYRYIQEHPVRNMPTILELEESSDSLIVIEEYFSGDTLRYLLDNHGPMEENQIISIVLQLCQILQQLHDASPAIIHRDIKPENILISPDGVVKLLDMNAARQFSPENNQDTRVLGTVGFAAPEQYGFQQTSKQTDIYALGVLMNVLRTGTLPAEKGAEGKLHPIITRCTQLDPKDRYRNCQELSAALRRLLPDQSHTSAPAWRKYLLPGMRSLRIPDTFFAAAGYVVLGWLTCTIGIENAAPSILRINRIGIGVLLSLLILLNGNYLGILDRLPITRSRNPFVRLLGVLLFNLLIFLTVVITIAILTA